VITPRTTRLVRAADLRSFRSTLVALATEGSPFDARNRLIVVPTRAAAHHLLRSIEDRLRQPAAVVLPDMVTRAQLHDRLFERAPQHAASFTVQEREALLTVACRVAIEGGAKPPFRIRPGLVGAMLEFFDSLKRHQKSVNDFERLVLGRLDGGAEHDRGAERLVRQTRFLAAVFREFERRCEDAGGVDEHSIRERLLEIEAVHPWRHVIVAVRDRAADRYGLYPVDWDLLARLPGLQRVDVVVTDATLTGSFHERIHQWLPGIEEIRAEVASSGLPLLDLCDVIPANCVVTRDREEEIIEFARWVRDDVVGGGDVLDRTALVVRQRLPYVYLAREVFRGTGIPYQMFDALPLAAEPYAAVVDVLFSCVSANFARVPGVALLRSPHLQFKTAENRALRPAEVAALDRALSEAGYLGGVEVLERLHVAWREERTRVSRGAVIAVSVLETIARQLEPLRANATVADHLDRVLAFLSDHAALSRAEETDDSVVGRQLRARAAILGLIRALRDAYRRFSSDEVPFDQIAAMVRRHIEVQTFAPRTGESGVHLVDADSAPFGEFDYVQLAGLVDGEWPEKPRRNIFYSPAILRDLGWPADSHRVESARGAFSDLLQLPRKPLVVSTFSLEHDSLVTRSVLLDQIAEPHEPRTIESRIPNPESRMGAVLSETARAWAAWRLERPADSFQPGHTDGHVASGYAVSALERYQDCPFQFFASNVLQLDEVPEDEPSVSPRARGRFIHEVFQRFFEQWDARGERTITPERVDAARALFAEVAEPLLAALPEADAALERTRLFGSAISVGIVDVVLGLEASAPVDVVDRWLEYRLDGEFSLGNGDRRTVPLRGVADRIDLLTGRRLRVIDYKTGYAPQPKRALQVPVYALCAQERLAGRGEGVWRVEEAAYVAFSGKRPFVSVIGTRTDRDAVLADARRRLLETVDGIERGEFPVRPYETRICSYCAYPSVCRKDYVGDE
jgi:RecB family exonuclease